MKDTPVNDAVTRGVSIADELRRMIQTGQIPPGTRLRQAELAKRFGTSITPVREAFPTLIRLGLIRQDSHRSPIVVRPSLHDLRDNIEIRAALEPLAARRAAERITPAQLAELQEIVNRNNEASDAVVHFDNDRDFHTKIYEAAGNPKLSEVIYSLRDAAYIYLQFDGPSVTPRHLALIRTEHEAILQALAAHDAEKAESLVAAHLNAVLARAINR